jgi:hypothetical protein
VDGRSFSRSWVRDFCCLNSDCMSAIADIELRLTSLAYVSFERKAVIGNFGATAKFGHEPLARLRRKRTFMNDR